MGSNKKNDVFREREVVSLTEIASETSLSIGEARDVLVGGSYMMDDKEELEEYLGMSVGDISVYFGPKDQ
jgi:hypothetical protein